MTALENPLRAPQVFRQSVWFDYIRRSLITSGELRRLLDEDELRGVTSNPAIFEKAITGSSDYRAIPERPEGRILDPKSLYERLAARIFKTPPTPCALSMMRRRGVTDM
jgi:transaldolase / glucose-6-phosphate isomerase